MLLSYNRRHRVLERDTVNCSVADLSDTGRTSIVKCNQVGVYSSVLRGVLRFWRFFNKAYHMTVWIQQICSSDMHPRKLSRMQTAGRQRALLTYRAAFVLRIHWRLIRHRHFISINK